MEYWDDENYEALLWHIYRNPALLHYSITPLLRYSVTPSLPSLPSGSLYESQKIVNSA